MRLEESQTHTYLYLEGVLTVAEAPDLRDAALGLVHSSKPVLIDCTSVERLDSSVFQVLASLYKQRDKEGLGVQILNPPEAVRKFGGLAGFDALFAETREHHA